MYIIGEQIHNQYRYADLSEADKGPNSMEIGEINKPFPSYFVPLFLLQILPYGKEFDIQVMNTF